MSQPQPKYFYCTFWYPTIFHQELKPLSGPGNKHVKKHSCDISDESENGSYLLEITLDYQGNLTVRSEYRKNQDSTPTVFVVTLQKTDHHRSGFVQYRVDENDILPECIDKFKRIILVKDVYHLAKEFYHEHEADPEKDAALRAVITPDEGGIDEDDNRFLMGFLMDFTPVFESYAREISLLNNAVVEAELDLKKPKKASVSEEQYQQEKKGAEEGILEMVYRISRLCENASIEYTYCKTLLSSKYNKSFVHNLEIDESDSLKDQKKEWRRNALNIRNSMRYIENIKYKNQNRLGRQSRALVQGIDSVVADVKDNTKTIQNNTRKVQTVVEEVRTNTENIKQALAKGKQAEKINRTLTFFSIFLSFAFGVLTLLPDVLWGVSAKKIWALVFFALLVLFSCILIYQYSDKYLNKIASLDNPDPDPNRVQARV